MFVDDFPMFSHLTCRFVRPLQYLGTQGELWDYGHL
jgi:hypothetical protein